MVFAESLLEPTDFNCTTNRKSSSHCLILSAKIDGVYCYAVYKHPNFSKRDFLRLLTQQLKNQFPKELHDPEEEENIVQEDHNGEPPRVIVFGDMNINLSDSSMNSRVLELFNRINLRSCLDLTESTTDYNTHLDVCFSNIPTLCCSTYENYYSYHKSLCISW